MRAHLNPRLEIEGLLRTMYDPRNTLALNVAAELEKHFGEKLYRTVIPRNVRLAEAPTHGIPALKLEHEVEGRAGLSRARGRDAAADEGVSIVGGARLQRRPARLTRTRTTWLR